MKMAWIFMATVVVIIPGLVFFGLGLHRKPRYILNFEEQEYGRDRPFVKPASIAKGPAVYSAGSGAPVLLFPYPHAHTTIPMVQSPLTERLGEVQAQTLICVGRYDPEAPHFANSPATFFYLRTTF